MTERIVIGVVGLGAMGLGIAQVYAQAGFTVLATDAQLTTREKAKPRLSEALAERDRKSTRLNSSHLRLSRMPSSA